MIHVLLTNDDGVAKEGLVLWREELIKLGMRVSVVAPATNQSGRARAVTCHGPTELNRVEDGKDPIFACAGTPVDCVRVGLLSGLLDTVHVVASGINHGVNLGDDATYSGTLGAALEGAMLGTPSIAVSQQDDVGDFSLLSHGEHHFALAWFAARLVQLIAGDPPPPRIALNANTPHHPTGGVQITRPASFDYPPGWSPPDAVDDGVWKVWPYARPGHPDPTFELTPGTDVAALAEGAVSLSPILAGPGLTQSPEPDTENWVERIVQGCENLIAPRAGSSGEVPRSTAS